ncbi:MAG TPA: hypothetical protein VGG74_23015 [Kofleriaceae bacterium]|jgi:hypothetical protein
MRLIALFVLVIAVIVVGIVVLSAREDAREGRERSATLDTMHDEAVKTLPMCTDHNAVALGFAEVLDRREPELAAGRRTPMRDAIDGALAQVLDASDSACAMVQHEIDVVIAGRPSDAALVADRLRVAEATAYLARVRAAMARLRAALVGGGSDDSVRPLLAALRGTLRD